MPLTFEEENRDNLASCKMFRFLGDVNNYETYKKFLANSSLVLKKQVCYLW